MPFIGGFMIAPTMERRNLRKRVALNIIHFAGGGASRTVLGLVLPLATPPNAVAFGSNRAMIAEVAKAGILPNIIGVFVIAAAVYSFGFVVFDIDPSAISDWAILISRNAGG